MLAAVLTYAYMHAKTMEEYGMDFYAGITLLNSINNICLQIWNGPKIYRLIEHLERFIEMSEFHWISYGKTIHFHFNGIKKISG